MNATSMDVKDKVFLVTGGTSGIGKATALGLARTGAKIVIISRSAKRGEAALEYIAKATGNERSEFLVADLSLQSSIKKASGEFKREYDNLHVLINVAGAIYFQKQLSGEGIDMMLAVNYLRACLCSVGLGQTGVDETRIQSGLSQRLERRAMASGGACSS